MVALSAPPTDLHSFRLAHPVVRTSTRLEVTTLAVLSMAAMTVWLLVLPLEVVFRLAV